jgi:hypothetical protein
MTVSLLPSETHAQWIHAFEWWYLSGDHSRCIDLLKNGVPLSKSNSKFLGAILAKEIRARSGKRTGLYRFTQNIIDNTIADLRDRGMPRKEIRDELIRKGLVQARTFNINALNQRMDGPQSSYVEDHNKVLDEFAKLYGSYL